VGRNSIHDALAVPRILPYARPQPGPAATPAKIARNAKPRE
jgi:hypothetical protein